MRSEAGVGEAQREEREARTEERPLRPQLVDRQLVTLEGGRYLIYYSFEAKQLPRRSQ